MTTNLKKNTIKNKTQTEINKKYQAHSKKIKKMNFKILIIQQIN